jgi:hypothetical protein
LRFDPDNVKRPLLLKTMNRPIHDDALQIVEQATRESGSGVTLAREAMQ